MEHLKDTLAKHYVTVLLMIIGTLVPGTLTLAIFNRDLFLELEFIKYLFLCVAMSMPTAIILFISLNIQIMDLKDETETALNYSFAVNVAVFILPLLIKVMNRGLSLRCFVGILIASELLGIWHMTKTGERLMESKQKETPQNDE